MGSSAESSAVDERFLELVARCLDEPSIRALENLQLDASGKERLALLAEKANEGQLTPEEASEYDRFIELADIVATIRLKGHQRFSRPSAA